MLEYAIIVCLLVVVSKVIWHKNFPLWLRLSTLGAFAVYLVFFTIVGAFIRPLFNDMASWSVEREGRKYSFRGTGVFINESDVITNAHVIEGCRKLGVRTSDGMDMAQIVFVEERNGVFSGKKEIGDDIAVIRTQVKKPYFAYIRRKSPKVGQDMISPEYTNDPGVFDIRTGELIDDGHYIKYTGPGRKGNSGSPIYNKNGYLVGIGHSVATSGNNPYSGAINIGTNIYNVVELLKVNGVKYHVEPNNSAPIIGTDSFQKSFAVGIMCGS